MSTLRCCAGSIDSKWGAKNTRWNYTSLNGQWLLFFFHRLYQKVAHLIFLPFFYFSLFILLWTPKPTFAFPTTPFRQRVFLLPYFVFGIFRVGICDGSSWQSEGDTLDT